MDAKQHWEHIYATKRADEVSWYQRDPRVSFRYIRRTAVDIHAVIVDVGGGASTLVDLLLHAGYQHLTVLDLSGAALAQARERIGGAANQIRWLEADILEHTLPRSEIDLWHDRAAFHFLTNPRDRLRYVEQVRSALKPRGHLLIATFAEDGPTRCSGLDVSRYSSKGLQAEFGRDFNLQAGERENHITPAGMHQSFRYCLFQYMPQAQPQPAA